MNISIPPPLGRYILTRFICIGTDQYSSYNRNKDKVKREVASREWLTIQETKAGEADRVEIK